MLGPCDLLTQLQRKTRVLHIIFNNESLNFVGIEQLEAGIVPFGVDFKNPNFPRWLKPWEPKTYDLSSLAT